MGMIKFPSSCSSPKLYYRYVLLHKNTSEPDHISQIFTKIVKDVRGEDGDDSVFIATMGVDILIIISKLSACRVAATCIAMLGSDLTQRQNGRSFGISFAVQMF